jgi:hypothetical protein
MTANDLILLFTAFGGFVVAPALLLWGLARLTQRKQDGERGTDIRPDIDSPDDSGGDRAMKSRDQGRQRADQPRRASAGKGGSNPKPTLPSAGKSKAAALAESNA